MPHVKHRSQGGPCVACCRLDEHVLPLAAAFQIIDQQRVEEQAACEAQIFAAARQTGGGLLDGLLQSIGDSGRECRGNVVAVAQAQPREEFRTEAAGGAAVSIEEGRVQARRIGDDLAEDLRELAVAGSR